MFGVLTPSLNLVTETHKELYNSSYCNLCASLSASGMGVLNRFFLVTDFVTIDWLLTEDKPLSCTFSCRNCMKGGVIGQKKKLSVHQKLLAALSSYACGVKILDNAQDSPTVRNKALALAYKPIMNKASAALNAAGLLDTITHYLEIDKRNEHKQVANLSQACEPTEKCYELITVEIAKRISNLPLEFIRLLGRYFGRYIYLFDAMQDMDEDKSNHDFNVLNLQEAQGKNQVMGLCLDFLKPMRLQLQTMIQSMDQIANDQSLHKKFESVFIGMEQRLIQLVTPLNEQALLKTIYSFSNALGCNSTIQLAEGGNKDCCPALPYPPGCSGPPGCSTPPGCPVGGPACPIKCPGG